MTEQQSKEFMEFMEWTIDALKIINNNYAAIEHGEVLKNIPMPHSVSESQSEPIP